MIKFILSIITLLLFAHANGQSQLAGTKWIGIANPKCDESKIDRTVQNLQYDFINERQLNIHLLFQEKDFLIDYELSGRKLITPSQTYSIIKISNDTLVLDAGLADSCSHIYFANYQSEINRQKANFFLMGEDTIYVASKYNYPKFKGENYKNSVPRIVNRFVRNSTCKVELNFIITKEGTLIEEKGNSDCRKNDEKLISNIFKELKSQWTPMVLANKSVSCYVRINVNNTAANMLSR